MAWALLLLVSSLIQEQHYDLRDQDCGSRQLLIGELDGLKIYATCETVGGNRTMSISATIDARSDAGQLESFTLGFCANPNPVISAASPDGWVVEVGPDVRWRNTRPENAASALKDTVIITGFSLLLKPGWMRSRYMDVQWGDNANGVARAAGTATTHDCPR